MKEKRKKEKIVIVTYTSFGVSFSGKKNTNQISFKIMYLGDTGVKLNSSIESQIKRIKEELNLPQFSERIEVKIKIERIAVDGIDFISLDKNEKNFMENE